MSITRPDIIVKPNKDNDLIALLNEQAGFDAVTVGTVLRIQNKSDNYVYVQQSDQVTTEFDSGTELKRSWQTETDAAALGVRVSCGGKESTISVEVVNV